MNRSTRSINGGSHLEMQISLDTQREINEWHRSLPPPETGFGAVYSWPDGKTVVFSVVKLAPGEVQRSAATYRPTTPEMLEAWELLGQDRLRQIGKQLSLDVSFCKNPREMVLRIFTCWMQRETADAVLADAKAQSAHLAKWQKENMPRIQAAETQRRLERQSKGLDPDAFDELPPPPKAHEFEPVVEPQISQQQRDAIMENLNG